MRIPAVKSSSIKDIASPKSMATKNTDHYTYSCHWKIFYLARCPANSTNNETWTPMKQLFPSRTCDKSNKCIYKFNEQPARQKKMKRDQYAL